MENNQRPTFGAAVSSEVKNTQTTEKREEIGAIWKKQSKANTEFLNIKLNIPKKTLEELLAKTTTEKVALGFVAFTNRSHSGDDKRPTFRIYEDLKK